MAKAKNTKEQDILFGDEKLSFLFDFDGPDDGDFWSETYNYFQWSNPAKAWEFPLKYWAGTAIESNYKAQDIDHGNGQTEEPGMLIGTIHLSVIAWRYTWEKDDGNGRKIYSAQFPQGEEGWRKRYNFLCLLREAESDELCILTARGWTGEYIYNAFNQFRQKMVKLAARMSGGRKVPGYIFWTPLTAGEKKLVGANQQSAIYPPVSVVQDVSELDNEGLGNLLRSLYIGDELRDLVAGYLFEEGQTWASERRDNLLPAGGEEESNEADILPGNVLYIPDLSGKKPPAWIECAMSTGLFNEKTHASNALAKVLRTKRPGNDPAQQWEAFRADIERRWAEKVESDEAVEREKGLREGTL